MRYGHPLDSYTDIAMSLNDLELKLADFPLNLKHLQYECFTPDTNFPCSFGQFAIDRSDEFANFGPESKKFLTQVGSEDDGRCFVLEMLEDSDLIPYMICVKATTAVEAKKLQKDIRNAYTDLVQSMPLEQLPDDVSDNEEFEMESWIDGEHSKQSYFVQKTEIVDAQFDPIFEYPDIDPLENWKCGIKTDNIELPDDAVDADQDESCCIQFDTKGVQNIFCSTELPMCAYRVRQFARKIKVECLLTYHSRIALAGEAPTPAELK